MTPLAPAQAQSFTRGGTNSTTTTTDYNLGTNWSNAPTGTPPVVATQSAIFDTTGSTSVAVTSGSIAPASWTLTAGAVLFDRIMVVTPYAAGHFTTYSLPVYAEQVLAGSGTFALDYAAKAVTDPRTELGVRTDRSFAMANGILTLRGRLARAHDYTTDRNSPPYSRRCPARPSSSTAPRKPRTPDDHGLRRDEMAERLVGRGRVRGRVLRYQQFLRRQGRRALHVVSALGGERDPRAPRHPITQFGLHFLRYAVMRGRLLVIRVQVLVVGVHVLVMRVMRAHVLMVRRPLVAACGALDWCAARRRRGRDVVGLSFFRLWERKP